MAFSLLLALTLQSGHHHRERERKRLITLSGQLANLRPSARCVTEDHKPSPPRQPASTTRVLFGRPPLISSPGESTSAPGDTKSLLNSVLPLFKLLHSELHSHSVFSFLFCFSFLSQMSPGAAASTCGCSLCRLVAWDSCGSHKP